ERPRPLVVHSGRECRLNLLVHDSLRFLDEANLVAVADAALDVGPQQAILALDHRRSLDDPYVGNRGERHLYGLALGSGGTSRRRWGHRAAHAVSPIAGRSRITTHASGGDQDVLE